ncbi:MAG: transglutaminase-like domain-containing protein [Promethearchaeota archaeon]
MKKIKLFLIFQLLIVPGIISHILLISTYAKENQSSEINIMGDDGVSNYKINQSVTYEVEFDFSLTHNSGSNTYYMKFARLNDRQPDNPITDCCPPYQESKIISDPTITGESVKKVGYLDNFNNTYDSFNATLGIGWKVTYNVKYEITLNELYFESISDKDIGEYNYSDVMFALYCNGSDSIYNRNDPDLIAKSNSLVKVTDNPIEKAEKINEWVASYLKYDDSMPAQEKGASWAYDNKRGDCSEYSSLMITLLRIQNIPARKVTGFLISNDPRLSYHPDYRPEIGDKYSFESSGTEAGSTSNFLGHAWVEYYVPNIGWIQCDPTWQESGFNYFNRIDYLRFNVAIGANLTLPSFSGPISVSEFGNPGLTWILGADFSWSYNVDIEVTDVDLVDLGEDEEDLTQLLLWIILICAVIGAAIIIIIVIVRRRSD